jgi:succinate dehydrogenase / fumarate reductase, iron-sulfur subunit
MSSYLSLTLKIWRQKDRTSKGRFETFNMNEISPDMSFLEMLDVLNQKLIEQKKAPIAFESDCREGICGACSLVINGIAHGPQRATTACQLHMRQFKNNQTISIEPFRAKSFPVLKDLVVDRSSFDRIMQSGGYISLNAGAAQDANTILIKKPDADNAFEAAACIGCGACVASCKNSSAMLFVGAKITQLALLPQGEPERKIRIKSMIKQMDEEGFGNCSNTYECEAVCPKEIKVSVIAKLNQELIKALV